MSELDIIFTNAFEYVSRKLIKFYDCKPSDEITPQTHAILTGLKKLPFPVRIIDVNIDSDKYSHIQDNTCQLIYHDLEKIGKQ